MGATMRATRPTPEYWDAQGYFTIQVPRAADYAQSLYREGYEWAAIIERLGMHYPDVLWQSVQQELHRRAKRPRQKWDWLR